MKLMGSALLAASLLPFGTASAVTPAEAAGHWEGGIQAPSGAVDVALDLAVGADGKLGGTFTNDSSQLTGLPLWSAKIEPPPVSAAVDATLAGEWRGALEIQGKSLPVVITLTNHKDGTATGSWSTAGGVAVPITIETRGRGLKIASHVVPAVYTAELSADGRTLSGTFTEGAVRQTLALNRATSAAQ